MPTLRLARKLWIYLFSPCVSFLFGAPGAIIFLWHILTCGRSEFSDTFEDPKFGFHKIALHNVWGGNVSGRSVPVHSSRLYDPGEALTLLPKILPKVLEADVDTLDDFLQVVQDHPPLKYTDPAHRMYDLYKAAAEAAEKLLDRELFRVSAFFTPP